MLHGRCHFVKKTLDLLSKERATEIEETRILTERLPAKELQRRGVCLLKLHITGRRSGLYGRTLVNFEPSITGKELPSHSITPGDIVGLAHSQGETQHETIASGIVSKVGQSLVSIAFDESHDIFSLDDNDSYKLTKLANDVTYRRLKRALNDLNKYSRGPASRLVNVLFGISELSPQSDETAIQFFNDSLDVSQKEAVDFVLRQRELSVVHGPPGTGKTTTIVEVILQAVKRGMKVVACAPSNVAVDNLVDRLAPHLQKIVRVGHPARLLPHIQKYSLDAIVSGSEENKLVADVRHDLDKAISKMKSTRSKGERQQLRDEMRHLRKELMQREEAATKGILQRADVVLVTLTSASPAGPLKLLDEEHFDLTVIDESSQALEAACWMALLRSPRCVLAGDHHQLPPTILSREAAKEGLELTLMERVLTEYGSNVVRMLTTQYRMNEKIMKWSSDQMYEGKLTAADSVKNHLLSDLPGVMECAETSCPLLMIDTTGCDLYELDLMEEVSKGNEGEADIVAAHVEKLISCGMKPEDIAVIAPYNLQVELLRIRLSTKYPKLEIKSVDGFQGREKEAVVISFVRSNSTGEVGFLAENRRINVAITRARRHVAVICDTETVSSNKFLKTLVDYFAEHGEVWSAQEYIQGGQITQTTERPEILENVFSVKPTKKQKIQLRGEGPKSVKGQLQKGQRLYTQQPKEFNKEGDRKKEQESDQAKESEFELQLQKFRVNDKQNILEFSSTLNSHDRLLIHQVSEKLGLEHNSKGEGKDRHIVVSKPGYRTLDENREKEEKVFSSTVDKPSESLDTESCVPLVEQFVECNLYDGITVSDLPLKLKPAEVCIPVSKSDKVVCDICGKDVISANASLHSLHCERTTKSKSHDAQSIGKDGGKHKKKKQDGMLRRAEAALVKVDDDDFDAMIAAVQKLDGKCCFKKCKTLTSILGHNCDFCLRRFCLAHHIPEIHGCGDEAKKAARQTVIKDGILTHGSASRQKKLDPTKRAGLQRKLDKKLDDMVGKRSSKTEKKK